MPMEIGILRSIDWYIIDPWSKLFGYILNFMNSIWRRPGYSASFGSY